MTEEEKTAIGSADPPVELNMVQKAEAAAAALKEQNDRQEALLKRMEAAKATELLGGRADAGQAPAQGQTEEQKKKEAAKEFFKGTQIAEAIEKHG